MAEHRTSRQHRRTRATQRVGRTRTVRTGRHRTTTRRRVVPASWSSQIADNLRQSVLEVSDSGRSDKRILVKIVLVVLALMLPLYLMALGGLYLVTHQKPSAGPQQIDLSDGEKVEYHVINGKVYMTRKRAPAAGSVPEE